MKNILNGGFFCGLAGSAMAVSGLFGWPRGGGTPLMVLIGLSVSFLGLSMLCWRARKVNRSKGLVAQNYFVMADIAFVSLRQDRGVDGTCHVTYDVQLSYHGRSFYHKGLLFDPTDVFTSKSCRVYLDRSYEYGEDFGSDWKKYNEESKHYYVDIQSVLPMCCG